MLASPNSLWCNLLAFSLIGERKWALRVWKAANCGRPHSDLWMVVWWQM
jgi:hypothetical protein